MLASDSTRDLADYTASEMTDLMKAGVDEPPPPSRRERLIAAACDLLHSQGIARTTLADIAQAADVPLGNVYYYFKTKDDIVAAVVEARSDQLRSATAALQRRYRTPKTRLKALVAMLSEQGDTVAAHGCPYGTLCTDLANHSNESHALAAPMMRILIEWTEQQFHLMGRSDAHDLAIELVAAYQGSAVLTNALRQPELMAHHARRLDKWINAIRV